MDKIDAKYEVLKILETDGIVYEHSTNNTVRIMGFPEDSHKFITEFNEEFPGGIGIIHEEITTKGWEGWHRAYFLNSEMSRDFALDLFKQFYELFAK